MEESLRNVLDLELEDDDTETGGTSFAGETVRDFLEEADCEITTLEELNEALTGCGIRPIKP